VKFETIEANSLFSIALLIEKQISRADEGFVKSKLTVDEITAYRNATLSEIGNFKLNIANVAKNFLDKDGSATDKILREFS